MDYYAKERWGHGKNILFRFILLYVLLYTLPLPYAIVPGISALGDVVDSFWNSFTVLLGSSVFTTDGINTQFRGSTDRLFDYLRIISCVMISAAGTFIWSVLDYHRLNYKKLTYWLRVHIRYYLFAILFAYGFTKIAGTHFSYSGEGRLFLPLGDSVPVLFAGSVFGISIHDLLFLGIAEILAAVLLLFRKTAASGAVISIILFTILAVNNFGYDYPVKQFSIHLVLFSIILFAYNGKKSSSTAVLNRLIKDRWDRIGFITIKMLFIGYIMVSSSMYTWQHYQQIKPEQELSEIYGIWEVESYETVDTESTPSHSPDDSGWQLLIIEKNGRAGIISADHTKQQYEAEVDTSENTVILTNGNISYSFDYTVQNVSLSLTGESNEEPLEIELNRYHPQTDASHGGFTWAQEYYKGYFLN
jgi:uncharacterized membrane protein YphA (DoxX/SURF4 family)